ncbi:MAG: SpoIIE family protein phosphatase [Terracidiphilus sp.]|nr:SpoIIE family protein phosphatase [Terracidiphilus sp.]
MPARSSLFPGLKLSVLVFAACGLNLAAHAQTPVAASAHTLDRTLVIDGLGKGVAPLDGPWQFHVGDDPAWAAPGFDDSNWEQLTSDKTWGAQGHPSYTGFAWYRRTIRITPAPCADANVALLIPIIDDAYELYWNGVKVGQYGKLPPYPIVYEGIPNQTFGLGPIRSGVLAVRVWKFALASNDPDNLGGFERMPLIGSPSAIAAERGNRDYKWLQSQQFRFGLTSLYALVALLSFVAWLRDRNQWLLFWMSLYALMLTMDVLLIGMRLSYPFEIGQLLVQVAIAIRETSGWFLLIWLLQLHEHPKLVRCTRLAAIIGITSATIDGCLSFLYPDFISAVQMQIADAVTTFPAVTFECIPAALVAYAIFKRRRLDSTRWLVAILAFLNSTVYAVENISVQGVRYTHWTLGDKIEAPLFTVVGNNFSLPTILRTLLFLSIVYAVIRYTIDNRRRQHAMEREFQNARELQQVLVPENLPALAGFNLTSAYRPAQEVGGDFFQIIPLEEGSTLIVLGDVSGKGLKAAMAVSMIVGAVRTLVETTSRPAEILAGLNRRLFGRLQGGFATAVALRLDSDGTCTISCAGHPAPYVNDEELIFPGTLPLGVLPKATFEESRFQMGERDQLALYTDGLLEARSQNGDLYSFARLKTLFATRPTAEQAAQAAVNFGQDDDITVLTLTRVAVNA